MGFVVLGIFSLTVIGIDGAVFTMLSHPLTTGALFLVVGMLYERRHTREIGEFRGIWKVAPVLGGLFLDRAVRRHRAARFLRASSASSCRCWARSSSIGRYAIVATFGVIFAAVYSCGRSSARSPASRRARTRRCATSASARWSWSCRCWR